MTLDSYLVFLGACLVLVLIPGPNMIYMLSRCVAQGRGAGVMAVLGINAGSYLHLIAAVTGLSAILMTSAVAFTAVKWAGAAYLVFLGLGALRKRSGPLSIGDANLNGRSLRSVFSQGFLSGALNPKVAMFFLALLPQFVHVKNGGVTGQLLLLGLTVNVVSLVVNLLLVLISSHITAGLRRNPGFAASLQKAMGVMFIGLGARLALERA